MKKILFLLLTIILIYIIPNNIYANTSHLDYYNESDYISLDGVNINDQEYKEIYDFVTANLISKDKTNKENLYSCFNYILNNIKYGNSNNDPYSVFKNNLAICEGYTNLYKVFCQICNIPSLIINGKWCDMGHAWNLVYIDNKWQIADTTNRVFLLEEKEYINYETLFITPSINTTTDYDILYANDITIDFTKSNDDNFIINNEYNNIKINSLHNSLIKKDNNTIKSITLNDYINNIDKDYFNSFKNLETINSNNNPYFYTDSNILYNRNNKDYYIPLNIKEINFNLDITLEKNTFYNLLKLEKLTIGDNIKIIKDNFIDNTPSLKTLILPNSIKEIDLSNIKKDIIIITDNQIVIDECIKNNIRYQLNNYVDLPTTPNTTNPIEDITSSNNISTSTNTSSNTVDTSTNNNSLVTIAIIISSSSAIAGVISLIILINTKVLHKRRKK